MNISLLTLLGLVISGATYFVLAWRIKNRSTALGDHLPLGGRDTQARVRNSKEFSAATVATTISLATVILAYADLASYFGAWLLWTVVTTAIGIYLVRLIAPVIWRKLSSSGNYRPTLHGFLGTAFDSSSLAKTAALCTSFGFIGALAVELTVGSRFLGALAPIVPLWLSIVLISGIGVGYTMMGGFRVVIVTDRVQMWAIWSALLSLGVLIVWQVANLGGPTYIAEKMPKAIYDFSWREGLTSFLIGIAIINIPTFIADMSIWQRIAGSKDINTVKRGLTMSVFSAAFSWTAFAIVACMLVVLVTPKEGENSLLTYLFQVGNTPGPFVATLFVIVIVGLYGASLSTASTQLIAAGHTLHIDVLRHNRDKAMIGDSRSELILSRWLLLLSAVAAVFVVEGLRLAGFTIADLVFSVYGAQLGLVPLVLLAIFVHKNRLLAIRGFATAAVMLGFVGGWASAGYGKWIGNSDLVFLAPAVSLGISTVIVLSGFLITFTSHGARRV